MAITGIVAEYNPFHLGHLYHLQRARECTEAEGVVVVMSGNFTQRGEPAIVDKYRRTTMALTASADVVLELPVSFASASAERFAAGAVEILDQLGVITHLVWGAEDGSDDLCGRIAESLCPESETFRARLQRELRAGHSYPEARGLALEEEIPGAAAFLSHPNNILAVEYRKALLRRGSAICPRQILRVGASHGQDTLPRDSCFSSASAIRRAILDAQAQGETIPRELWTFLPETSRAGLTYALSADDLSSLLTYALCTLPQEVLASLQDMSPELANRALSLREETLTFSQLARRIKTRNVTLSRVNRALLHTVLQLPEPTPAASPKEQIPAVRLLGFRRDTPLMRRLQDNTRIPIVTKLADADPAWFACDLRADAIYRSLVWQKTGIRLEDEYRSHPVIIS